MQGIWAKLERMYDLDDLEYGVSLSFLVFLPCVGFFNRIACSIGMTDTLVP